MYTIPITILTIYVSILNYTTHPGKTENFFLLIRTKLKKKSSPSASGIIILSLKNPSVMFNHLMSI